MSEAGSTSRDALGEPNESTRLLADAGCASAPSRASGPTPLPIAQLCVLIAVRVVDPIAYTQVFPYINQLLADLRIAAPEKVGYYSGFIESTHSVAKMFSVYQWGKLSDIVGRRPVVLFGLFGVAVSTIAFGLSKSLVAMLLSRFLAGLAAGNTAVFHSILIEITDDSNQNIAAPIYSLSWPIGMALGPLIGGALANAATLYPKYFSWPIFVDHPYLPPCIVTAACALLGMVLGYLLVKETLPSKQEDAVHDIPGGTSPCAPDTDPCSAESSRLSAKALLAVPSLRALTLSGLALCFLSSAFDVVFILFCYSPVDAGGLGLQPYTIGKFLAFAGTLAVFLRLIAMPYILHRFDYAATYKACMYLWPVTFALLPFFNLLARIQLPVQFELPPGPRIGTTTGAEIGIWIGLPIVLALSKAASVPLIVSVLLTKRCALSLSGSGSMTATGAGSVLGQCNGLVQFSMCLGRAVGPVVVSTLFTALNASTWTKRWGIGWTWSVVMVCFAVVGARATKGLR